ncbi:MAG TPA: YqaE/Pmp3 family membrane protein [Chloroflexota bacterium]|nr:YqaE/Pmp3 family membrane protein [Chloroflexota bacterium]
MLYLVAVLLPPLAVLLCGKPFQALLNVFLTLLVWVPGMIHAILVVHNFYADQRQERLIRAMKERPPAGS